MSLRHALLGLLTVEPASGWDLLKRFEQSLAFVWPATQSQLYTELNRMSDAGLVTVTSTGARNRKEYGITPVGRRELAHWITEVEPERNRRNDVLLRVFFLWTVDRAEAKAFLEREAEVYRTYRGVLEQVEAGTDWDESDFDRYARLSLESGLRTLQTNEEWALWAVDQIGQPRTRRRRES